MTGGDRPGSLPRIAVNLMWCRPGKVGGSEEYLARQLLGLPESTFEVVVYAPKGFSAVHQEIADRYSVIEMTHAADSRLRRMVDESTVLFRRTRAADLVHHGGGTVPVLHRRPILLTVHDLQYLEYPQYFSRQRLVYLRRAMPRAVATADAIAVPSHFVRRSVVESFGIDADDVLVVPHGVESTFGTRASTERDLRARYRLGDGPIVVYPAVTHPHKGHEFLLDVHERHWAGSGVTLVLIGSPGPAESRVQQRIVNSTLGRSVRRLGRVSAEDRDGLIAMARALVFPSEYEGFGAPVIEAMTLGTPVITSDRASLPEVVDGAGLVLPLDIGVWGGALDIIENRRGELVSLGRERCTNFSSSNSGAALAHAYRRLLDRAERTIER